jgi:tetratricopeptide (TPR) repeat protein
MSSESVSSRAAGRRKRVRPPKSQGGDAERALVVRPRERLLALLLGVGVFTLCFRCLYLWQIHGSPFLDLRIGDGEAYHRWAQGIAGGDWLGHGVFYQAPLYPYFLALVYRVLDDSVATVRVVQALLGAGSCILLSVAGMQIFGRRGAIAGILLAIYPPAVFLDGLIDKSWLATFLAAALLALLSAPAERMTVRRWLGAGITLGLLSLTRENALLLIVPILLWIGLGPFPGTWRARFAPSILLVAGCALILLPVGLRNLAVGGEFHLTTSQFGPNFYIGNHAGATGSYQSLVAGHGNVAVEREDATRLAEQAAGHRLGPGEVSDFWTSRALEYILSQPASWLKLMVRKLALTFNAAELTDTESQDVYAEEAWLLKNLLPYDFGLLFGMAALGAALTAAAWRRMWFLYAIGATYALSVAFFYVFARYRFPIALVLMLLAAGGIIEVFDRVRLRRWRSLAAPSAVAALAMVVSHLPIEDTRRFRATHYLSIAIELSKDPKQVEAATAFYQRALDAAPGLPSAQLGLGVLLAQAGRGEEAIAYYRKALAGWPDYAKARYDLAEALAVAGRLPEAAQEFAGTLRLSPDNADAHIEFGRTLNAMYRFDRALEQFQQGLAVKPRDTRGLVGLGVALSQLGRAEEAIRNFQVALEIDPEDAVVHNNLGWTLARQGRIAEAVSHFERALALDPNYANARASLDEARAILSRTSRR